MAAHTHTNAANGGAGCDLWYARAAISDVTHYDDPALETACQIVIAQTTDDTEKARATDLLNLIQGEAA